MKKEILNRFLLEVADNPKILASHISLFSAILYFKKDNRDAFNTSRRKLMRLSKLHSTATYHKCIRVLVDEGIISYEGSYNPFLGSEIKIINKRLV